MDASFLPLWITELEYVFWLAQAIAFLIAGVLIFRADRRFHAGCFLAGSFLSFLLVLWQTYDYSAIVGWVIGDPIPENSEFYLNIQSGLAILASGLMAYGIIVIALIQFRRSKSEP